MNSRSVQKKALPPHVEWLVVIGSIVAISTLIGAIAWLMRTFIW